MTKGMLLKVTLLVCIILFTGFSVIFIINYQANYNAKMKVIEQLSELTAEGIDYQVKSIFAEPVNVSLAMANSSLLKSLLFKESPEEDADFIHTIQEYLNSYKEKYGYSSVFLASAKTNRYYNFNGVDRILVDENSENRWFYNFLESGKDYSLNVDNDEASQNEITVFVNCRIKSGGDTLGIVGVGFRIDYLQNLLQEYAKNYGVDVYLINKSGNIEIAIDSTGWQPVNFFDVCGYPQLKDEILQTAETEQTLTSWINEAGIENYVVAQYMQEFDWHLIVEHNTKSLSREMSIQLFKLTVTLVVTGIIVILIIIYVIRIYNGRIIQLTAAIEEEKHAAIQQALLLRAETDGLTGLYNKTATEHYIEIALQDSKKDGFAFFIFDIDNLKQINDNRGHAFGDFVIREIASIIKNHFHSGDIVGRIGGDEFVAFLPVPDVPFAENKAKALSEALNIECSDGNLSYKLSASIGVSVDLTGKDDYETLYKNADTALYETKRRGKNGFTLYEE